MRIHISFDTWCDVLFYFVPLYFDSIFVFQNRVYYCALKHPLQNHKILIRNPFLNTTDPDQKFPVVCFNIDDELVYWNFFLDFGPLNLGQLHRFSTRLNRLLANARRDDTTVLFYSSTLNSKRANAIFLACAWQVLELNRSPEEAFRGFAINGYNSGFAINGYNSNGNDNTNGIANAKNTAAQINNKSNRSMSSSNPPLLPLSPIGKQTIANLPPFHDASPYRCTYELTLMDCLGALVKARQFDFFDWGDKFDVKEYEHFEQVEVRIAEWILQRIYMYRRKVIPFEIPRNWIIICLFCLLLRPTQIYSFFLRFKIKLCYCNSYDD